MEEGGGGEGRQGRWPNYAKLRGVGEEVRKHRQDFEQAMDQKMDELEDQDMEWSDVCAITEG
eukprot:8899487-Karenia_brevis.AAC.1